MRAQIREWRKVGLTLIPHTMRSYSNHNERTEKYRNDLGPGRKQGLVGYKASLLIIACNNGQQIPPFLQFTR